MKNNITLITPPDKIYNQSHSCLLVYPSADIRQQAQEILAKSDGHQTVYLYNVPDEETDIDWLLSVASMVDIIIIDYDKCSIPVKKFASYLISLPKTYWLTKKDTMLYNKLSPNRIYGLDSIEELIGGTFEETQ